MKQITNKTSLKQGDKTYQPVEVEGVIYWIDDSSAIDKDKPYFDTFDKDIKIASCYYQSFRNKNIVAQSQPKLEGIPVISLDSYIEKLGEDETNIRILKHKTPSQIARQYFDGFIECYKSNPNQFTLKDIEKAVELARVKDPHNVVDGEKLFEYSIKDIHDRINSISVIEVDEQFNIISYE